MGASFNQNNHHATILFAFSIVMLIEGAVRTANGASQIASRGPGSLPEPFPATVIVIGGIFEGIEYFLIHLSSYSSSHYYFFVLCVVGIAVFHLFIAFNFMFIESESKQSTKIPCLMAIIADCTLGLFVWVLFSFAVPGKAISDAAMAGVFSSLDRYKAAKVFAGPFFAGCLCTAVQGGPLYFLIALWRGGDYSQKHYRFGLKLFGVCTLVGMVSYLIVVSMIVADTPSPYQGVVPPIFVSHGTLSIIIALVGICMGILYVAIAFAVPHLAKIGLFAGFFWYVFFMMAGLVAPIGALGM